MLLNQHEIHNFSGIESRKRLDEWRKKPSAKNTEGFQIISYGLERLIITEDLGEEIGL